MIDDLLSAWPVDTGRSLMIGDSDDDMRAAKAAGLVGVRYVGGSLLELVRRHIE
ncbi:MAG: HAD hydrolase-like protein [Cereibacter sp.]